MPVTSGKTERKVVRQFSKQCERPPRTWLTYSETIGMENSSGMPFPNNTKSTSMLLKYAERQVFNSSQQQIVTTHDLTCGRTVRCTNDSDGYLSSKVETKVTSSPNQERI